MGGAQHKEPDQRSLTHRSDPAAGLLAQALTASKSSHRQIRMMDPKQDQYEYNLNCQQYIVKGPAHGPRGTGKVTGGLSKWIEPLKLQGKEQGI